MNDTPTPGIAEGASTAYETFPSPRIELVWPGKETATTARQLEDGRWHLEPTSSLKRLHPIEWRERYGDCTSASTMVVSGDRLAALSSLRRYYAREIRFAYLDVPRIEIDDKSAAFQGDSTYVYSTWLSVLRSHLEAVLPLMNRAGVIAVHAGDIEEPYARLLLTGLLGRESYVGTIVWQRSYGPRNMRGMKEFTATHDCIILFALDKSLLPAVGLRQDLESAGFANPDNDPRKEWRAFHKGARTRREKSDFNTYIPPYRWRILAGVLPEGLWRLNPLTGVIWGVPTQLGDFPINVEVTDSKGATASAKVLVRCVSEGSPPSPRKIPWLFEEISPKGRLRVTTEELPLAIQGQEYFALCLADGGEPFRAEPKRPGSGRYWEFSDDTLQQAYASDKVDLGDDGNVIVRIKTYADELDEGPIQNQQTWWSAKAKDGSASSGFTQDATKHLKKMLEAGLIDEAVTSAKPERLLKRLLSIFASQGAMAIEVFGGSGDLAAVGLKTATPVIYLSGSSNRDLELLDRCALPRLRSVVNGNDQKLEDLKGEVKLPKDAYIPFEGGGGFIQGRVADWLFEQGQREDVPRMNRAYRDPAALATAILSCQGFLPTVEDPYRGLSPSGACGVIVPPDVYLSPELAATLVSEIASSSLTIFYFMSSDDFDAAAAAEGTTYIRVPAEIGLF